MQLKFVAIFFLVEYSNLVELEIDLLRFVTSFSHEFSRSARAFKVPGSSGQSSFFSLLLKTFAIMSLLHISLMAISQIMHFSVALLVIFVLSTLHRR